ncbi:MAG: type II toxin-antitoxin system VapC family toxin [Acidimicrobiia bacterium]
MTVFVDTSALLAVLERRDANHGSAGEIWHRLITDQVELRTNSYVVAETSALVQRRIGMDGARDLHRVAVPALSVRFVDAALHDRAVTALLAAARRSVSLVDWASFEQMREERLGEAFAFDADFEDQGFRTLR